MRRAALIALGYVIVTAVMVGPFANYSELGAASYEGDARLIIWTLAWDNHAVLTRAPVFESNIFFPAAQSLAYNEHLFGLSLFTLPIYAATGNPVLAYNIVWLLSFLLNCLAAHLLLRRYTGSDVAAAIGSFIFTFSFYKMLHGHGHLHLVWTWLLPISVLCLERWRERPTWRLAMIWSMSFTLLALTSWYLAVIGGVAQTIVIATLIASPIVRRRPSVLWQLVAAAALSAAILWPFARPYRQLPPVSPAEIAQNAADLRGYLVPPMNTWAGRLWIAHVDRTPRWIWGEQTIFIGWIALVLAGVGLRDLLRNGNRRLAVIYTTMAVAGYLLSLGPSVSWSAFSLLELVPGMGGFRAPARFSLLVVFGVSVLAAAGARWVHDRNRFGRVLAIALVPLMLSEWYVVDFPGGKPQPFPIPPIYRTPAVAAAHSLVSLPEYRGTPEWYRGADYLYFSTAHWRPIVNGFGRSEPPNHARVISHVKAFPGPNNARTMRELGVEYIVLHGSRYSDGGEEIVRVARESADYELVGQIGSDYLFRVRPAQAAGSR